MRLPSLGIEDGRRIPLQQAAHHLVSCPQSAKGKEPACGPKDTKGLFSGLAPGESSWSQHRQRRLQDHGKERKELLSTTLQVCNVGGPRNFLPVFWETLLFFVCLLPLLVV